MANLPWTISICTITYAHVLIASIVMLALVWPTTMARVNEQQWPIYVKSPAIQGNFSNNQSLTLGAVPDAAVNKHDDVTCNTSLLYCPPPNSTADQEALFWELKFSPGANRAFIGLRVNSPPRPGQIMNIGLYRKRKLHYELIGAFKVYFGNVAKDGDSIFVELFLPKDTCNAFDSAICGTIIPPVPTGPNTTWITTNSTQIAKTNTEQATAPTFSTLTRLNKSPNSTDGGDSSPPKAAKIGIVIGVVALVIVLIVRSKPLVVKVYNSITNKEVPPDGWSTVHDQGPLKQLTCPTQESTPSNSNCYQSPSGRPVTTTAEYDITSHDKKDIV